ncbi:TolC family protein [Membranicola marinus]|uniref:TolC family protein n=1 Tax=Membranihabitans marinus TaxID=1227546 RepID=A0A953HQ74_9BACT|nr:TolC family protein [Membranihabitans marinus]MBY5959224.1 TolC family protein [Membranihabitans marinus]
MKFNVVFIMIVFFALQKSYGQEDTLRLTLYETIEMAIRNNPDLKRVKLGESLVETQIAGIKSAMYPQVSANFGFSDNFSIAKQLLPGEIVGQPGQQIPVEFGTRFGLQGGVEVNQLLYDKNYRANLNKVGLTQNIARLQTISNTETLVYNTAQLYIQYQISEEQRKLLEDNINRTNTLVDISKAQYENGIIKKLDLDQIRVNRTNLESELTNTTISQRQLINALRFYLDLDSDTQIVLDEELNDTERYPLYPYSATQENIQYKLIDQQLDLTALENDVIKAGYYPTVSAFFRYNYSGQSRKLTFDNDIYSGFGAGTYGVNVSIPVFDGFRKKRKLQENKVRIQQLKHDREVVENNIQLEFDNAVNELVQNEQLIEKQQANMDLAKDVYEVTQLSYQEGVAPLTELLNAETSLKNAQTQYLSALINFKLAELDHIKASGQLAELITSNQ